MPPRSSARKPAPPVETPRQVDPAWEFLPRFRRKAFGWQSQPAITRIKEAVAEIKKVARQDPLRAAAGALLFLERVAPAIEQVDSSSGAIGTAVNRAVDELAAIIAAAPADPATRAAWLERLYDAYQEDEMPYLERLGDVWGDLCATQELASAWADRLLGVTRMAWSPDPNLRGFFKGTTNCLSALLKAGRHQELLDLLKLAPFSMWHYRSYGVKALAALGNIDEAVRYAEEGIELNDSPTAIARGCEEVLRAAGRAEEAYRYALQAHPGGTYLATFRALAKRYPQIPPAQVLGDLARTTPGAEGKWFAAAKDAGLYEEALRLARQSPCDPKTLARAARDHLVDQPAFALDAGLLALRWLAQDYGYETTSGDVWMAYDATMKAAAQQGRASEVQAQIRALLSATPGSFAAQVLGRALGAQAPAR